MYGRRWLAKYWTEKLRSEPDPAIVAAKVRVVQQGLLALRESLPAGSRKNTAFPAPRERIDQEVGPVLIALAVHEVAQHLDGLSPTEAARDVMFRAFDAIELLDFATYDKVLEALRVKIRSIPSVPHEVAQCVDQRLVLSLLGATSTPDIVSPATANRSIQVPLEGGGTSGSSTSPTLLLRTSFVSHIQVR